MQQHQSLLTLSTCYPIVLLVYKHLLQICASEPCKSSVMQAGAGQLESWLKNLHAGLHATLTYALLDVNSHACSVFCRQTQQALHM